MAVLGVSLGSRVTGIAIIKNGELLVSRSLTLRNKKTSHHTAILDNYIQQYRITIVVIKTPPATHLTDRLKQLLGQCVDLFRYQGCLVEYKETKAIKAHLPGTRNKRDVMRVTTSIYPDLIRYQLKEAENLQKYHVKMFEAVAIAHIESLDRRR